jgi:hypothetical protein
MARLSRSRVGVAVAVAICLGAVAVAFAKSSQQTNSVAVGQFDAGSVTASCPAHKSLAMIGFATDTGPKVGLVVSQAEPRSKRTVSVAATNVFVNSGRPSATAYCGPKRKLKKVGAETSVAGQVRDSYPSGTATARCPRGTTVRLGGFAADVSAQPDGPALVVSSMVLASPRLWSVTASNGGPATGGLRATAWCGKGPPLRPATAVVPLSSQGGSSAAAARCQGQARIALAGFTLARYGGDGPYVSQMLRASARAVQVKAFQFSGRETKMTAVAYCTAKRRPPRSP